MARTRYMTSTIENGRTKVQELITRYRAMVETAQTDTKTTQSLRDAVINHALNKVTLWQRILDDEPMPADMVDKLNESGQDMFDSYLEWFGQKDIREISDSSKKAFQTYKKLITDYNDGVNILAEMGKMN
jgi:altronate dehydratase